MAFTFCPKCGAKVEWSGSCSECGASIPLYEGVDSGKNAVSPRSTGKRSVLIAGVVFLLLLLLVLAGVVAFRLLQQPRFEPPSDFQASAGAMQVHLSWQKVNTSDSVWVIYRTGAYPASPADGTLVYEGSGVGYVHKNLEYGTKYYYGIWAVRYVDGQPEYSSTSRVDSASPLWIGPMGETLREFVETAPNTRIVGADGEYIELLNNPVAKDPSWDELKQFLMQDATDQVVYDDATFVCADFAEMLHNNAEDAGIRAAYVSLDFVGQSSGHALNAFNTTDRGRIYIDDTGTPEGFVCSADKVVDLQTGEEYIPESIFECDGYSSTWEPMGMVVSFRVQW
jgi:hypothetical protein